MAREVTLAAPAKVNLHLGIHTQLDARRYHLADSIMVATSLADCVTVRECARAGLQLSASEDLGVRSERSTTWVAAQRMCEAFDEIPHYAIDIERTVPAQSGLGGSSTDAASTILALCELWGLDALDSRVVDVARSVGADVPFFLRPLPSYLVGVGDVLERVFPEAPALPLALVRPARGISTAAAYREFDRMPQGPASPQPMCDALHAGDVAAIAKALRNNLEEAAFRLVGECADVRDWLVAQEGVLGAQVSGSGSCVFAVCEDAATTQGIATAARDERDWWATSCTTVGLP